MTIERSEAELLISAVVGLDAALGQLDSVTSNIGDEHDRARCGEAFGKIFEYLYGDLAAPVFRQFPDLLPERRSDRSAQGVEVASPVGACAVGGARKSGRAWDGGSS